MKGDIGGVRWRVVQGKKSANDLRLDISTDGWIAPRMTLGFLFADFYANNERTLAQEGYLARSVIEQPGKRYLNFIIAAMEPWLGWEVSAAQLEFERASKKRAA